MKNITNLKAVRSMAGITAFVAAIVFLMTGCPDEAEPGPNVPPGDTAVTFTAVQTGGADGTADTTGIVFTFSGSVDSLNLSAADITVGGAAAKGAATLTGSGATWTLSPVTVSAAGAATVATSST